MTIVPVALRPNGLSLVLGGLLPTEVFSTSQNVRRVLSKSQLNKRTGVSSNKCLLSIWCDVVSSQTASIWMENYVLDISFGGCTKAPFKSEHTPIRTHCLPAKVCSYFHLQVLYLHRREAFTFLSTTYFTIEKGFPHRSIIARPFCTFISRIHGSTPLLWLHCCLLTLQTGVYFTLKLLHSSTYTSRESFPFI